MTTAINAPASRQHEPTLADRVERARQARMAAEKAIAARFPKRRNRRWVTEHSWQG